MKRSVSKYFSAILVYLVFSSLSQNVNAQWVQTNGPYGGGVPCLAVSGTNIFAGSNGGVFLSTNNGTNWAAVNSGLTHYNLTEYISALAVSGTNIFAGTNGSGPGSGVFLSTNNGTSWTSVNNGLTSQRISALAVSGSNLIAGTDGGVFLSTNNGTNWTVKNIGLTNLNVATLSVSGTNIFAGTNSGIFLSTNNGTNWTVKNSGLTNLNVVTISVSGTNIFAGTDGGVFLSTNNGTNWTAKNNGLTTLYVQAFASNGSNFFAGTSNGIFLSTNNGTNWSAKNNGLTNLNIQSLIASGTMIFAGTATGFNCGLFLTSNNGTSWTAVNNGLTGLYIPTLAVNGTNLFAGTDGGGVILSSNNGSTWIPVNNGLTSQYIFALTFSGTKLFAGGPLGGLYLSTNNGTSWSTVNNGIMPYNVYALAALGTNIFAGTDAGGIFLSTNNGTSWVAVNNGLTNLNVSSIAVSGTNIFAGTFGDGIFLSTNNGTSWTAVNNGLTYLYVNALAVSGTKIFTGTFGAGVYLSTNNGTNWAEAGLTNLNVRTLVASGSNLFAGTDDGIYLSINNGTSWYNMNQGFNFIPSVGALLVANNYIIAGTNGYSIWKRPLSDLLSLQAPSNLNYDGTNNRLLWTLSPSFNVEKYLVYKKGSDNIWKSVADSGGIVNSDVNFYNIQTSGFNYYRVAAISNTGDTAKCDSVYVGRGYVLRKWNSGTVEPYKLIKHSFQFGNTSENMWPSSVYNDYNNYNKPEYPREMFRKYFLGFWVTKIHSRAFSDWKLFSEIFGYENCYWKHGSNPPQVNDVFKYDAVNIWYLHLKNNHFTDIFIDNFPGVCSGFAIASALSFAQNTTFYNQFPIMNNVDSIYGLQLSSTYLNSVQKAVNHLGAINYILNMPIPFLSSSPSVVLDQIINDFSELRGINNQYKVILALADNKTEKFVHAVLPYAVEKDLLDVNKYYVYIYDSKYPGNSNRKIEINKNTNKCNYENFNQDKLTLYGGIDNYLGIQKLPGIKSVVNEFDNTKSLVTTLFSSDNSSIFIINPLTNDTISGFRKSDSTLYGDLNNIHTPITDGRFNIPKSYSIPVQNTKVCLNDIGNDSSGISFAYFADTNIFVSYERLDSLSPNQNDVLQIFNKTLSVFNPDALLKKIYLTSIISNKYINKNQKSFLINNLGLSHNDSVSSVVINSSELKLVNYGIQSAYNLNLVYSDSNNSKSFNHFNIIITPNSTHIISPTWDSIKTKPVKIFVDIGNNGTIDDTLFISDTTTTKITNTNNEIPNKFELYQNYPNPFNPRTKIKFDIPKATQISIRIYDILGREIECLVNEYVQPGKYSYDFNSNNLSSGVYFYRLQAGDYTNIKKMVLLK